MRTTIAVSLPKELLAELEKVAGVERVSRNDIARESIRDHLFLRQFRARRTNGERHLACKRKEEKEM